MAWKRLDNLARSQEVYEMHYDNEAGEDPSVGTLRVKENNGAITDYFNVEGHKIDQLRKSTDLTSAYHGLIKATGYKSQRVGVE